MRNSRFLVVVTLPATFGFFACLAGCEYGGGAVADVTVTFKADEAVEASSGGDEAEVSVGPGGVGTFKGKVVFGGNPPALNDIVGRNAPVKDAETCAAEAIPDERLVVGEDGGVQHVFVYLAKAPRGVPRAVPPEEPVIFDQKGCRFLPHTLIARAGQVVNILSDDPIAHNTHTFPSKNTSFNQGIPPDDRTGTPMTYRKAENTPVSVKCDYHAWMSAWHLVLDHPYAAITNENGEFEIAELPAGMHKFQIWHEGADGGYVARNFQVEVPGGGTVEKTIEYPVSKFAN